MIIALLRWITSQAGSTSDLGKRYADYTRRVAAAEGVQILGAILKRGVPLTRYLVHSLRPLLPCDDSRG